MIKDIWHTGYEWKSKTEIFGLPFIHIAVGRDRETGRFLVAKGIIAIGQFAIGMVAIGQFAIGLLFGLAQFAVGIFAIAQFAIGITAIGQFAIGNYVLCQIGYGRYVWSLIEKNVEALKHFRHLLW